MEFGVESGVKFGVEFGVKFGVESGVNFGVVFKINILTSHLQMELLIMPNLRLCINIFIPGQMYLKMLSNFIFSQR